jgi:hypothetical protein
MHSIPREEGVMTDRKDLLSELQELNRRIAKGELSDRAAKLSVAELAGEIEDSKLVMKDGTYADVVVEWENLCKDTGYEPDVVLAALQEMNERTTA